MTKKINGHDTSIDTTDIDKMIGGIGQALLLSIDHLLPGVDVDLDKLAQCDAAFARMFTNKSILESREKMAATVGIMAFGIAQNIQAKRRNGVLICAHEDEYRERLCHAPLFQQVSLKIGLDKSAFSKFKCPKAIEPREQPFVNWLFSQMVFSAALYNDVPEAEAKLMCDQWGAVEWDVLHTEPERAVENFKRFRNRNR